MEHLVVIKNTAQGSPADNNNNNIYIYLYCTKRLSVSFLEVFPERNFHLKLICIWSRDLHVDVQWSQDLEQLPLLSVPTVSTPEGGYTT